MWNDTSTLKWGMYVKVVPMVCLLCGYKRMHVGRSIDMNRRHAHPVHGTCGFCCMLGAQLTYTLWVTTDSTCLAINLSSTLRCDLCPNLCPGMCCPYCCLRCLLFVPSILWVTTHQTPLTPWAPTPINFGTPQNLCAELVWWPQVRNLIYVNVFTGQVLPSLSVGQLWHVPGMCCPGRLWCLLCWMRLHAYRGCIIFVHGQSK